MKTIAALCIGLLLTAQAQAQERVTTTDLTEEEARREAGPESTPAEFIVGAAAFLSPRDDFSGPTGGGGALDLRWQLPRGAQLGLTAEGSRQETVFISGKALPGGSVFDVRAVGLLPISSRGPLQISARARSGASWLRDQGPGGEVTTRGVRTVSDLALLATVTHGERWQFQAGPVLGFAFELSPTVELADQAQLLLAGVGYRPAPNLLVVLDLEGGGSFGFNGDNAKVLARSTLGLRVALGGGDARRPY